MSTATKLSYLNETKSQLKDMINYGLDEENKITSSTTFRNYVSSIKEAFLEALRTPDTLFTNLPKKSGTGANITLNDTANAPMRIELGASELTQASTPTPSSPQAVHTISGSNKVVVYRNIYDYKDLKQSYSWLTYDEDGWYTATINNTSSSSTYYNFTTKASSLLKANTTYAIILEIKSISSTDDSNSVNACDRWGQFSAVAVVNKRTIGTFVGTSTTKSDLSNVTDMLASTLYVRANSSLTTTFRISVLPDTTITESNFVYVPYAEPQEADIDLKSINYVNFSIFSANNQRDYTSNGVSARLNDDGTITLNGTATGNRDFYVSNNGVESTNKKLVFMLLDGTYTGETSSYVYTDGYANAKVVKLNGGTKGEVELTTGLNYTLFDIYVKTGNVYNNARFGMMLVDTSKVVNKYVPYYDNGEYCKIGNYEDKFIRNSGKNEYDINTNPLENSSTTRVRTTGYISLKAGTHTISYTGANKIYAVYYDSNNTKIGETNWNTGNLTFTFNQDYKYVFYFGKTGDATINASEVYDVMLNLGSTPLPYEPYGSNEWYIKKNIGKVDLGTLSWVTTYDLGNDYRICATTGITDIKYASVNTEVVSSYAEKYKIRQASGMSSNTYRYYLAVDVSRVAVQLEKDIDPTGLYYYPLATPTYTNITGTLAEQLENIYNNLTSYSLQTNISQVSNDLAFNMNVSAIEE